MAENTEAWRVIVRIVHFASSIALFGELAFFLWLGRWQGSQSAPAARGARTWRQLRSTAMVWLVVVVVSGALWFQIEAAVMSGSSEGESVDGGTLWIVLSQTLFGEVWSLRLGLAVLLAVLLVLPERPTGEARWMLVGLCACLAAVMLGALAWAGHANAQTGIDRVIHRTVDVLHLLAAGAWLGALPPLAAVLSRASRNPPGDNLDAAAYAAGRFSALGIACVAILAMTGLENASFTVGAVSALTDTAYGRLLSIKLSLFALMLGLAAINRVRLTSVLADSSVSRENRAAVALRLRRNTVLEVAAGLVILAVVGVIGITMPPSHAG